MARINELMIMFAYVCVFVRVRNFVVLNVRLPRSFCLFVRLLIHEHRQARQVVYHL